MNRRAGGLTDVPGVKVGHFTDPRRPTGCTVVLVEGGAVAGVEVMGGAPGTRETDLLDPVNTVERVHAVLLAGGSAFGLDAAGGVMAYLEERGVGFVLGPARVPIVPGAVIFDLLLGEARIRPDAASGRAAAEVAGTGPIAEGSVGAGAGATVGKLLGFERVMRGGLGTASVALPQGGVVGALVVVNAVGDVVEWPGGRIVAGARDADGRLADTRARLLAGAPLAAPARGGSTVIGVVATDVRLTKAEARRVARMAHDGLARTIVPSHTPWDGDTLFALSAGTRSGIGLEVVGALAAEAVSRAVVRGVRQATRWGGIPSAQDLPQ